MKYILIILTLPLLNACASWDVNNPASWDPSFGDGWNKNSDFPDWANYSRDRAMGLNLPKSHYGIFPNRNWTRRGYMTWDSLSNRYKPIRSNREHFKHLNNKLP